MKETNFKATAKTWWITEGEFPMAGSMQAGCNFTTINPVRFFSKESEWKSETAKIEGINIIEEAPAQSANH